MVDPPDTSPSTSRACWPMPSMDRDATCFLLDGDEAVGFVWVEKDQFEGVTGLDTYSCRGPARPACAPRRWPRPRRGPPPRRRGGVEHLEGALGRLRLDIDHLAVMTAAGMTPARRFYRMRIESSSPAIPRVHRRCPRAWRSSCATTTRPAARSTARQRELLRALGLGRLPVRRLVGVLAVAALARPAGLVAAHRRRRAGGDLPARREPRRPRARATSPSSASSRSSAAGVSRSCCCVARSCTTATSGARPRCSASTPPTPRVPSRSTRRSGCARSWSWRPTSTRSADSAASAVRRAESSRSSALPVDPHDRPDLPTGSPPARARRAADRRPGSRRARRCSTSSDASSARRIGESDTPADEVEEMFLGPTTDREASVLVHDGRRPGRLRLDRVRPDRGRVVDRRLRRPAARRPGRRPARVRRGRGRASTARRRPRRPSGPCAAGASRRTTPLVRRASSAPASSASAASGACASTSPTARARARRRCPRASSSSTRTPSRCAARRTRCRRRRSTTTGTTRAPLRRVGRRSSTSRDFDDPDGWWLLDRRRRPGGRVPARRQPRARSARATCARSACCASSAAAASRALLLQRAFAYYRDRGFVAVQLGVDSDSPTGANHLYEKVGMRPHRVIDAWSLPIADRSAGHSADRFRKTASSPGVTSRTLRRA